VVHAGIVVVRTSQQYDAQTIFALELVQHLAGGAAHSDVVEVLQRPVTLIHGAPVFFGTQAQNIFELLKHLALEEIGIGEVDEGIQEADTLLLEEIAFFREGGLYGRWRGRNRWAGT